LYLSALTRAYSATGDRHWLEQAAIVFKTLQQVRGVAGNAPRPPLIWLAVSGDDKAYANLWFEKYPTPQGEASWGSGDPSYVISAHLAATLGVYDYWRVTKARLAGRMVDGGATTMLAQLKYIRVIGEPSRSALLAGEPNLADHRVVTRQLSVLAALTQDRRFARWASRFAQDAS
jgi:hypothetical protein